MLVAARLFLIALSSACLCGISSGALADDEIIKLIEEKCSLCHSPKRALDKIAPRSYWEDIVKRMQSKLPESISDADVKAIVEYLSLNNAPK